MSFSVPSSSAFRNALLRWYRSNRRDLPWRRTRDPYAVWISEIMLQQTRVAAVVEKYREFLGRFPTVHALAVADLDAVLSLWSGLGYYRRARMLHQAARVVVGEHKGVFPQTANGWRTLPGIGRYTGAAVASIAFNEPVAVVDGNVDRVLERLLGERLAGELVWSTAQGLLDPDAPGEWNQAMMELGAVVCTPAQPACSDCPVRRWCLARGLRTRRTQAPRKRSELWYVLDERNEKVSLVRRADSERRMAGMWELPSASAAQKREDRVLYRVRHSITDTDYAVFTVSGRASQATQRVKFADLQKLPLTGLTRKILRRHLGSRFSPESAIQHGTR